MARAIAFFMQAKVNESVALMDGLLIERPNDAYLYDLKGQILFESARVSEAVDAYRQAAKLLPSEPLILTELGKVELARNNAADTASAVVHLEKAVSLDKENGNSWQLLAIAYGKQGNTALASLAMAERSLLAGDADEAIIQSTRAMGSLAAASPAHRRADDLKRRAQQMRKEQKDEESPI